jgi:hypothetical protein
MKKEKDGVSKGLKLGGNKEAVSTVIGAMLILAILVIVYTAIQVSQVPTWNKGVELDHMNVVYSDMMFLKSDIENTAMLETPKSSNIHMGVRYPDRMIFHNPGVGVYGRLTLEDDVRIVVEYTVSGGGTMEYSYYNSSRIIYEAVGMINSPKLVYEHGSIIKDFGTTNITTDEQSLIVNDDIYIPVVSGTTSTTSLKTSMGTESLTIFPYTETITTTDIECVNITLTTNYPEVWEELLADVNTSETNATVVGNMIYINSTATKRIMSPVTEPSTYADIYAGMLHFSTTMGATPAGTQIDPETNYPRIAAPCIYSVNGGQQDCGQIKEKANYVNVTATIYNAPGKDEVYADLTMLANCTEYESYPVYAWTLNMTTNNITTSIDPPDALDSFPNNFTATWTVRDMDGDNDAFNGLEKDQFIFTTLWATNSTDNQQYVAYALAVIK